MKDNATGNSREKICGYVTTHIVAGSTSIHNYEPTEWYGDDDGYWGMSCSSEEVTFEESNPTITYDYLPVQSDMTCGTSGDYLTQCDSTLNTTDLKLTGSTERGAYIDQTYKITGSNPTITVSYRCGKGIIYSEE